MFSYQRNFTLPTEAVTREQFWALLRDPATKARIEAFRQTGDARQKRSLPAFMFQATFDESLSKSGRRARWRKQSATRLTGLVVMDVDHVPDPGKLWADIENEKLKNKNPSEPLGILLAYVTPSGQGLKVVFRARAEWGNLIDNQHEMARRLGLTVDESCKDASRMSFVCREEDVLYIDEEGLFGHTDTAFAQHYEQAYRNGHSAPTRQAATQPAPAASQAPADATTNDTANDTTAADDAELPLYHGVTYQAIVQAWLGDAKVQPGDRHRTSLILADHLRYITDNDPRLIERILRQTPFVGEIVRERGEDVAQTVRSAQAYTFYKSLPRRMQQALDKAGAGGRGESLDAIVGAGLSDIDRQLEDWGRDIDSLAADFPLLRDLTRGLRPGQHPAALFVGGGLMMTLMTRCTYRFYHRPEELRRLNCSVLVIGDPASGKSFAARLYRVLARPIVEADQQGRDAINAYRELMKTKGANKEKPRRPRVVVRVHPARTSNAQFIQDMVSAVEEVDGQPMQLHMLTFDTELDNTLTVQRGGSWIDKQSMELKAFHNEEDGQAYSNVDSVMQDFAVTWNYIYTGTPMALRRKVSEQNFGSGLATRLTVVPLPTTGFEMMPRQTAIDTESDQRLDMWARRLDRTKGTLPLAPLVDQLYDWTARRMMDARDNDSRAEEMLLKRCAYHALNFAAPFIVMRHWADIKPDGDMWRCDTFTPDEADWRLARLIADMQYAFQRHYFGQMAAAYFDDKLKAAHASVQHRSRTVECFMRLPQEFTNDDVMRVFSTPSLAAARAKTSRLVSDCLVERINENEVGRGYKSRYRKTGRLPL